MLCFLLTNILVNLTYLLELTFSEWLGAIPVSFAMIVAPGAVMLSSRVGVWRAVLSGVSLASLSLALLLVSNSVSMVLLFYGLMFGLGESAFYS